MDMKYFLIYVRMVKRWLAKNKWNAGSRYVYRVVSMLKHIVMRVMWTISLAFHYGV